MLALGTVLGVMASRPTQSHFVCTLLNSNEVAAVIGGQDDNPNFLPGIGLETYSLTGDVSNDNRADGCIWAGREMQCDVVACFAQVDLRFDTSFAPYDTAKSTDCGGTAGGVYGAAPPPPQLGDGALWCPDELLVRTPEGVLAVDVSDHPEAAPARDAIILAQDALARLNRHHSAS